MKDLNNSPNVAAIRYFWRRAWQNKHQVIGIFTVLPFNVLANQVLPPIILANVLNRLAKHDFDPNNIFASFGWELIGYTALIAFGTFSFRIIDHFQWRLESRVEKSIADQIFEKMLKMSLKFHFDNFSGTLVSQAKKLMGGFIRTSDTTVFNTLPLVLGELFSIVILIFVAPLFAVILFVFSVSFIVISIKASKKVRRLGAEQANLESLQTGVLADAITNIVAIKSFAKTGTELVRFQEFSAHTAESTIKIAGAHQRMMNIFGGFLSGIDALSLLVAVLSVMLFNADVAAVFLIFNYTATIGEQLFSFSNSALRNYNRAIGDSIDMVKILNTTPEVLDPEVPEPSKIVRGGIQIKNVTFAHSDAKSPIFENLNITIKPGEKVGLVGRSGSGKTTFTRLLLRFSDIQAGQILIDGQNISKITQNNLHQAIAYVPQEPLLFHRSIRENIAYSRTSATQSEVESVAKMANADGFINLLPQKYDTLVGERGVKLSGGQRQRVAIARAMLKNAPILVFDEATSSLDSESESLIQGALWRLMENRTAIVIAHRLSTIQEMDRIIVLDSGKVVEQGSHKELIKLGGTYSKLWLRQSGGFLQD